MATSSTTCGQRGAACCCFTHRQTWSRLPSKARHPQRQVGKHLSMEKMSSTSRSRTVTSPWRRLPASDIANSSILAALLRHESVPLGSLAELLGMERSTLNRNLKPLEEMGLVATAIDKSDARVRALQLTSSGRALLDQAIPIWARIQSDSLRRLNKSGWPQLRTLLHALS